MTTRTKYGSKQLKKDFGKLTFANSLESYRLGEEMSQKDLAKKLKISPQSLCDLEKGRRIPTPSRAALIAKLLKQPISFWVQLALQDAINYEKLKLKAKVEVA